MIASVRRSSSVLCISILAIVFESVFLSTLNAAGTAAATPVTGITVSAKIVVGGALQLLDSVAPSTATNLAVTWTSSNPAVATVTSSGSVHGIAPGTAQIVAEAADGTQTLSNAFLVTVVAPVKAITLPASGTVPVGSTLSLTPVVLPANASNPTVSWTSSNSAVAKVSSLGVVTGVSAGTAQITAHSTDSSNVSSNSDAITVTVPVVLVNQISLPSSGSLTVGSSIALTATVLPANANNRAVTWLSSNPAVATVNAAGTVTGVSAGSAQITAVATDGSNTVSNPDTVTVAAQTALVNGQCGLGQVIATPAAPTSNLCLAGTASQAVAGTGNNSGLWQWSCTGANGGTTAHCSSYTTRAGASPTDGQGNVGATSYQSLPFASKVSINCWGCSDGLEPVSLFYTSNPQSFYNNAANVATVRLNVQGYEQQGTVPYMGLQNWDNTYDDTTDFNTPDYSAWRSFIANHPQYWDRENDGGTVPVGYRASGGQFGYIAPLTPLDPADCPPGMKTCTWGDEYAYRMSLLASITGSYSVTLSDYSDSFPYGNTNLHGFNPRIVANFAQQYGYTNLNSLSTAQQSAWIVANAYSQWNDFYSQGFGHWDGTLASRIGTATGRAPLVNDQCSGTPLIERNRAEDPRIVLTQISTANYTCIWDNQEMQAIRPGPFQTGMLFSLGGAALTAAYEPNVRYGENLESDDAAYWAAMVTFYGGKLTGGGTQTYEGVKLVTGDEIEAGYKFMKRNWLYNGWAHIADRSGHVRRAMAFAMRDYWDAGVLTAPQLGPLQSLIQSIEPTHAFGPAFYYSSTAMRAAEAYFGQNQQGATPFCGGNFMACGNEWYALSSFLDGGGVGNYYISDAALPALTPGSPDAPSAWIVPENWYLPSNGANSTLPPTPDPVASMSATETAQLNALSQHMAQTPAAEGALANQPLSFTTTGGPVPLSSSCLSSLTGMQRGVPYSTTQLTGFGFIDQNGRTIVVVSNPNYCADAVGLSGTINLNGLAAGTYTVTNLFTNDTSSITVSNGSATIPVSLTRWDSTAFAISK